jgi:hypothetical protein
MLMFAPFAGVAGVAVVDAATICPSGFYPDTSSLSVGVSNVSSCAPCPFHTYNPVRASSNISACLLCPAGTCTFMSGSKEASACVPCPSPPAVVTADSTPIPSVVPLLILGGAVASSGRMPRVIELVQFLSAFCTALASEQQNTIAVFQAGSLTSVLVVNRQESCSICPGFCIEPLVLVLPTFALLGVLTTVMLISYIFISRSSSAAILSAQKHLMATESEPDVAAGASRPSSSSLQLAASFGIKYYRGLIEASSSYMIVPAMFVFVMNAWPSSFSKAESRERAMIILLPFIALIFRSFVIVKRFVKMTYDDQKQLCVASVCYCLISIVLSASFMRDRDARRANASFPSAVLPQCIVLCLLAAQLVSFIIIRRQASEPSLFFSWRLYPKRDLPVADSSSCCCHAMVRFAKHTLAASVAGFIAANYMVLSQIAIVITGLVSSFAPHSSGARVYAASIIIGCIPLLVGAVHILRFIVPLVCRLCNRRSRKSEILLDSMKGKPLYRSTGTLRVR